MLKVGFKGCDLKSLGLHLLKNGFLKQERTARRIRIIHGGVTIVDTTRAMLVWEHAAYPQYYVPEQDIKNCAKTPLELGTDAGSPSMPHFLSFYILKIAPTDKNGLSTGHETDRVLRFLGRADSPEKHVMVRFEFGSMDQWFEEDTPIYVHPKDPYKRVDLLVSRRKVRIDYNGQLLAESSHSIHLLETGLPTRYYIPYTAVPEGSVRLLKSETVTECPYKGTAGYYSAELDAGDVLEDLVWFYRHPTIECAGIAGMICFYNEKVNIQLDGKVVETPGEPGV